MLNSTVLFLQFNEFPKINMLSGNRFVFVSIKILREILIHSYGERGGKNAKKPPNVTFCHRNNLN